MLEKWEKNVLIIQKPNGEHINAPLKSMRLIKNPSLSHHLLLIISIFIDYLPRLADYGVIFFEQKFRCIPIRLSDIEFRSDCVFEEIVLCPAPINMTLIDLKDDGGTVTNLIPQQPCNPPPRDDWDRLFQLMFDEYFNPLTIAVSLILVAAAPRGVDLADSPVSMSIDQDAPSTKSPMTSHFHDDPLYESLHEDSTYQGSSSNVRPIHTPFESLGRWTKDHPIANVIGDPSRSVSTRKQLQTDAMWCYFDAFLTSVELRNFKQEMTEPSWINAMQEEIHEFERLQV
ncbi:hypothetical protein Tco_0963937 [Tanacetum coccineum]